MRQTVSAAEKRRQFLRSRILLSLIVCAVLLIAAFVLCFFVQYHNASADHADQIVTRIAETEPPTVTRQSPVPSVEITSPEVTEASAETP